MTGTAFEAKFRKVFTMCGSDKAGERQNALEMAVKLCDQQGITFIDAVEEIFGKVEDDGEREQLMELMEKYRVVVDDNKTLADEVTMLRDQVAQPPQNVHEQINGSVDTGAFLKSFFRYPQMLLGQIFAIVGVYLWLFAMFGKWCLDDGVGKIVVGIVTAISLFWVVISILDWTALEYVWRRSVGASVLKACVLVVGLYGTIAAFTRDLSPFQWLAGDRDIVFAGMALGATALATFTNWADRFVWALKTSPHQPYAGLREMFR